jgi:hypothetical protein
VFHSVSIFPALGEDRHHKENTATSLETKEKLNTYMLLVVTEGNTLTYTATGNKSFGYGFDLRKRGSLDVSQPYWPLWPVTGIALPLPYHSINCKKPDKIQVAILAGWPCVN